MAEAKPNQSSAEDVASRIRELNEKLITAAKQNGSTSLDVYEKTLADMLQFTQKAADSTQSDVISAITKAHTDYISSISQIFTGVTRDRLK